MFNGLAFRVLGSEVQRLWSQEFSFQGSCLWPRILAADLCAPTSAYFCRYLTPEPLNAEPLNPVRMERS
jgi:hypothetical protein